MFFLDPDHIVYFWLVLAIFFLLIELSSPGLFFFISFCIGSCFAALACLFNLSLGLQIISAIITSIISFFIFRYYLKNFFDKNKNYAKSNVDALVGQKGIVTQVIDPNKPGLVNVNGEIWSGQTEEHNILQVGTIVKVIGVKGNRVIVKV